MSSEVSQDGAANFAILCLPVETESNQIFISV
jgi:hypothetical protein